jgi:hypothetical protein
MTAAVAAMACPEAHADHRPKYVIPGHPDVLVIIDGIDASGAVVTGDWGLGRARAGLRIDPGPIPMVPVYEPMPYYPGGGPAPRYGRHEVEPRRKAPRPAVSYSRSWSAGSDRTYVETYSPPVTSGGDAMNPEELHPQMGSSRREWGSADCRVKSHARCRAVPAWPHAARHHRHRAHY